MVSLVQQRLVQACTEVGELHCWLQSLETRIKTSRRGIHHAEQESSRGSEQEASSDSGPGPEELKVIKDHCSLPGFVVCVALNGQCWLVVGHAQQRVRATYRPAHHGA
jgi:hypothetical protein